MKLSEILEDADLLAPNAFSIDQKLRMANQTQRQLFYDYPLGDSVQNINIVSGQDTYTFPCEQQDIKSLVVGDFEYSQSSMPLEKRRSFGILDGNIVIYPMPTANTTAKLYYQKTLTDLTPADLNTVPPFPVDFHELLVLGIAYRLAQRVQDYKLAGELEVRFKNLAVDAASKITKPVAKRVRILRSWS